MEEHVSVPGSRREIGYPARGFAALDLVLGLFHNRRFIKTVARRDLTAKYRGAFLGILWMVGTPAALALAYGFMTVGVFGSRLDGTDTKGTFVALWFSVSLWQFFAETVGRSAAVVSDNAALVKRSPFPLAALPPAVLATSAIGLAVSFLIGAAAYALLIGIPPASWMFVPLILLPFVLFTLAAAYLVAAIGAFSKDIRYILPLALTIGMLVTPVLYPSSRIPAVLSPLATFNPMTPVFDALRSCVLGNAVFSLTPVLTMALVGFAAAVLAFRFFSSKSPEFADVL
jgi:lipopolysaccharide transport system permease protein